MNMYGSGISGIIKVCIPERDGSHNNEYDGGWRHHTMWLKLEFLNKIVEAMIADTNF